MDPLLCFPTDLPPEVTLALQNAGLGHQTVSGPDEVGDAVVDGRVAGWSGAVVVADRLLRDDLFDDFCVLPARPEELVARLQHLFWRAGQSMRPDIIEYGSLVLNLETYQAAVAGRVLDLTYMEYELLRFLAGHPAKVFTRETLLSRVWGYEYYGGARTVDVH